MIKHAALLLAAGLPLAATAAPETYVIDGAHTFPRFEYSHFGFLRQASRFDKTSGTIVIDREAHTGSVDVVIDASSVDTGYSLLNTHLQAEEFFDTSRFPTITFRSTKMNFANEQPISVDGVLTVKGITRPVRLELTSFQCMPHPIQKKDACGANAVVQIKRSDFNAGKYAPLVSDALTLVIPVEAIKP